MTLADWTSFRERDVWLWKGAMPAAEVPAVSVVGQPALEGAEARSAAFCEDDV